ncbi:hypothetical protein NDU88_007401 [Pleurodeles waltl]|uniref:Uncharacterized protein n=1 Tax=Pleurodeles waltl TaxID=8319 RepID=A0AAV7NW62_PLEWA|nr:hypothetical protein NDU88_007401 [Pleurodeles waltl]
MVVPRRCFQEDRKKRNERPGTWRLKMVFPDSGSPTVFPGRPEKEERKTGTFLGIRPSGFPIALISYPQESSERRSAPDSV